MIYDEFFCIKAIFPFLYRPSFLSQSLRYARCFLVAVCYIYISSENLSVFLAEKCSDDIFGECPALRTKYDPRHDLIDNDKAFVDTVVRNSFKRWVE